MNGKLQLIAELLESGDDTTADIEIMALALKFRADEESIRKRVEKGIRDQVEARRKLIFCDRPDREERAA